MVSIHGFKVCKASWSMFVMPSCNSTKREPLQMSKLPEEAWENVSIDFCEIGNEYALVIIDEYSRYPVVEIVSSTSSNSVIPKLVSVFNKLRYQKWSKLTTVRHLMGTNFGSSLNTWGSNTGKLLLCGLRQMQRPNDSWERLKRCYTHQNTGNKICFHFLEITEQLPIAPLATRLQLHFWGGKHGKQAKD